MRSDLDQLSSTVWRLWTSGSRSVGFERRHLVVGGRRDQVGYLSRDNFLHLSDPGQVGINTLGLLVEDPLTIQEHFHDALAARGNSNCSVWAVGSEEFIRHPRGGSMVLSRYAVSNL